MSPTIAKPPKLKASEIKLNHKKGVIVVLKCRGGHNLIGSKGFEPPLKSGITPFVNKAQRLIKIKKLARFKIESWDPKDQVVVVHLQGYVPSVRTRLCPKFVLP
jgi:hypothetical protein